jgi:hypothetical protein
VVVVVRVLHAEGVGVAEALVDAGGERDGQLAQRVQQSRGRAPRHAQLAQRAQHVVRHRLHRTTHINLFIITIHDSLQISI